MISRGPHQPQQFSKSVTYTVIFRTYKIIFLMILVIYSATEARTISHSYGSQGAVNTGRRDLGSWKRRAKKASDLLKASCKPYLPSTVLYSKAPPDKKKKKRSGFCFKVCMGNEWDMNAQISLVINILIQIIFLNQVCPLFSTLGKQRYIHSVRTSSKIYSQPLMGSATSLGMCERKSTLIKCMSN